MSTTRREFLVQAAAGAAVFSAATGLAPVRTAQAAPRDFKISLASYSLHRAIGTDAGKIQMVDLPKLARDEFDIDAIELVNWMLASKDATYIDEYIKAASDANVKILLIMVDRAGAIGGESETAREDAIKRHSEWIDVAAAMGCHSIRMNWAGADRYIMVDAEALQAFMDRSVAPLRTLCDYADSKGLNVIIENHGGPSSYPKTLERLIQMVDHERFGTLPDFGNFPPRVPNFGGTKIVDVYENIDILMRYAKAVSAKCYDFDDETGNETTLDYPRIIRNVVDEHGYDGYIGIEYEGNRLSEFEGIRRCKALLERLRDDA